MARKLKESANLNCKIEKTVSERLVEFTRKTKLSKTATVERALTAYISHYEKTGKL